MSEIVQFCRICFRNNSILRKLHEIDIDGVILFDKLKSCVPEIVGGVSRRPPAARPELSLFQLYSNELEKYELICMECCQLLKTAYMFKELCIRSNILLHECLIRNRNGFVECLPSIEDSKDKNDNVDALAVATVCKEETKDDDDESLEDAQPITEYLNCYVCNATYTDKEKFEQHILLHKNNNKHLCFHCGRSFSRKTYLKKHIFIHTGIRPFVCYLCNMTFNRKNTLETHMLIHSGTRNHKCTTCGKCFRLKCALDRHLLIHSEFKAHKCTFCGKGFGRKDHLEKHIRVHRNFN